MTRAADMPSHENPELQIAAKGPISESLIEVDTAAGTVSGHVLGSIWRMIALYRGRMWLAIALGLGSALCQIVPPIAAGFITAKLLSGDVTLAFWWALGMLLSALAGVVLFGASTTVSHYIAADVQRDRRQAIGAKLKSVPLGLFSSVSPTELRKLIVDDVEKFEDGVAHLIPELTAAFVGPLALFTIMLVVDWRLGLAAALPTFAGFFVMSLIMRSGVEPMNRFNHAQLRIATTMTEVIKAISVVKSYNNGDAAIRRADEAIEDFRSVIDDWIEKSIVPANWFYLLASSNLVFITPLSLWLWYVGSVGLPTIVFFHLAAMSLVLLVSGMFGITNRLRLQESVVARWEALMALDDLPVATGDQLPDSARVQFENVRFAYEKATAIDGVCLDVPAGSSLALVGPSGSGKTTLARLLARFWDVAEGRILIGGVDIRDMRPEVLSDNLSFVFQDVFLFSRSVADNIRIGKPEATDEEVIAAARAAQADEFISALSNGYETILGDDTNLSLGQKQRIAIARALLRDAPVLVLDEATAFADPESEREVQKAISALAKDKTLIVIAHRLSTVRNADCIAFLQAGKVLEMGRHEDLLFQNGAYSAQWNAHQSARSFQISNQLKAPEEEHGL